MLMFKSLNAFIFLFFLFTSYMCGYIWWSQVVCTPQHTVFQYCVDAFLEETADVG